MNLLAQVGSKLPPGLSTEGAPAPEGDIREIAPPVAPDDPRIADPRDDIAIWILVGIGLLALGLTLWRTAFANRRPAPPALPSDPQATAVSELVALERTANEVDLTLAQTAKSASEILARFLHRTTGAPALYRTATELTRPLPASGAPPVPALIPYTEILAKLEEARFAPGSDTSAGELIESVRWAITSSGDEPPPLPN
ncbi:hypothetical protein OAF27_02615 [Verrucomicrobiales bacterium]|nr:hypothetical protein [Verrucomicrobiales bacterium]